MTRYDLPIYGDTDIRYDEFPITEESVEHTDVKWIGMVGPLGTGAAQLYHPVESTVYEGEVDVENERVVIDSESRIELEESLGEYIESIGEEHGWEWLSEFARERLEKDGDE